MKKKFFLLVALCVSVFGYAQERWISGVIKDGESPISNVNIQIVNQGTSIKTNAEGKYRIQASPGDILFYSSPGMESIQIRVEDVTRVLNLNMFLKIEKLENVTVTKKRRASQKELEEDYYFNTDIINTVFGYVDRGLVPYTVRTIDSDRILPGEYDLANVLRNRFPGIIVSDGLGFGTTFGTGSSTGFAGASAINVGRSVQIRGRTAIFDIDGQIFTQFPDFIDVQNIARIGIIPSFAGTVRYGNLGNGGVVVINTKNGIGVPKRDKKGFIIDRARLKNNFYDGKALTAENVANNAPEYLKELKRA
ncbi:MAG: hypothetical protein AAFY00_04930, partial [Bacteroidota bacterium]